METRDPKILDLLKIYDLKLDTPAAQAQFRAEHQDAFPGRRDVTGMLITAWSPAATATS